MLDNMVCGFDSDMPCIHGIAAIRKRHDQVDDYVHPWLCMKSIHKTYAHCIKPVPSEEFWVTTDQLRPAPPPIKWPATRILLKLKFRVTSLREAFKWHATSARRKAITIRPVRQHLATQTGNQKRKKLRRLMKTHKPWCCFLFHNQPLNQRYPCYALGLICTF